MAQNGDVLIGIDGGGSNTRVAVTDMQGSIIAYQEYRVAASRYKDRNAKENVHIAIREALSTARKTPVEVRGLAAGIAGYGSEIAFSGYLLQYSRRPR